MERPRGDTVRHLVQLLSKNCVCLRIAVIALKLSSVTCNCHLGMVSYHVVYMHLYGSYLTLAFPRMPHPYTYPPMKDFIVTIVKAF